MHQIPGRVATSLQVFIAVRIPGCHTRTWILRVRRLRASQGQPHSRQPGQGPGGSHLFCAVAPSGERPQRHGHLGHADPRPFIAIVVDLRKQDREELSLRGWLVVDDAVDPAITPVEAAGAPRVRRQLHAIGHGPGDTLQRNQRSIGDGGIRRWRRFGSLAHPVVEGQGKRAVRQVEVDGIRRWRRPAGRLRRCRQLSRAVLGAGEQVDASVRMGSHVLLPGHVGVD